MVSLKEVIEAFERNADYYEEWYRKPLGRYVLRAELNALNSLVPKRGLGLDVGGGTGEFSSKLKGREVICLDPALRMLKKAREKGVDCVAGVAGLPPFRDSSFDFLLLVTVLEFLREPVNDLKSLKRLLRDSSPFGPPRVVKGVREDYGVTFFYALPRG
ncbi:MAG: hypothetical protein B6U69_04220 [Thermofilum sp. ex4484_15]|nr:MAG: hypothetical protein B6U69_04220 [Thermofilum sp. ex4484_15]